MTRRLKGERAAAYETVLPEIEIKADGRIAPSSLFTHPLAAQHYFLEIGFGAGEHLAALMDKYRDTGLIGAEPFVNGVAAFCLTIRDRKRDNVRIFTDDAMILVRALADACLERIYVLNPDPWPKKRHHKRRLIRYENLEEFARVLKPGGLLVMATDVDDLAGWMVTQATNHPAFEWTAGSAADWRNPPEFRASTTRYAEKGAKAGRTQRWLVFKKLAKA